ncbi:hypothetical protein [Carnimonas bestiolae]|uniref:hypothetical protein n=1 Tax=Carnimonas bestiolae TaxID=3402172 RepID=UPI003EDC2C78
MAKCLRITVPGVFANPILQKEMPEHNSLLVYAKAFSDNGIVPNSGSIGDGNVIGDVDISQGRIVSKNKTSYIKFGDDGSVDLSNGYTVLAYSQNLGHGALGGYVDRDPDADDINIRELACTGIPSSSELNGKFDYEMTVQNKTGILIRSGLGIHVGETMVIGYSFKRGVGYTYITISKSGDVSTKSDSTGSDSRTTGHIEWGGNLAYDDLPESSSFAFWNTKLSDDDLVTAGKMMLGL